MKLTNFFALLAVVASVEACKCMNGGTVDTGVTQGCCGSLKGNFRNGNDCQAGSISEHLSNFWSCCSNSGRRSDCDCPRGCASSKSLPLKNTLLNVSHANWNQNSLRRKPRQQTVPFSAHKGKLYKWGVLEWRITWPPKFCTSIHIQSNPIQSLQPNLARSTYSAPWLQNFHIMQITPASVTGEAKDCSFHVRPRFVRVFPDLNHFRAKPFRAACVGSWILLPSI